MSGVTGISNAAEHKPIRVLLFSTLFPHDGEPTLGVFVRNRLNELRKTGKVDATVIAPVPWFPFKNSVFGAYGRAARASLIEEQDGLTVYHPRYLVIPKIGMMLAPHTLAWTGKRALKALLRRGQEFDLIDAHYLFPDAVAAAKLASAVGIPFVATARGSDVSQIGFMAKPKKLILDACAKAEHLIAVSQSLKNLMVNMGVSADKITPLRNGIDATKFERDPNAKTAVCQRFGLDASKPIIVFAGWLIPRKRVDIVIDAVSQLSDAQALIVGDGPLMDTLKSQVATLGLERRVVFVGRVEPEKVSNYFSAADVFCLPSEREGWANVMLEAMACGVPVVARAVDGAVELITEDKAGRLVEGSDAGKYADAITSVINARYDVEEVRAFAQQFDWKSTTDGQLKIFERAVLAKSTSGNESLSKEK